MRRRKNFSFLSSISTVTTTKTRPLSAGEQLKFLYRLEGTGSRVNTGFKDIYCVSVIS